MVCLARLPIGKDSGQHECCAQETADDHAPDRAASGPCCTSGGIQFGRRLALSPHVMRPHHSAALLRFTVIGPTVLADDPRSARPRWMAIANRLLAGLRDCDLLSNRRALIRGSQDGRAGADAGHHAGGRDRGDCRLVDGPTHGGGDIKGCGAIRENNSGRVLRGFANRRRSAADRQRSINRFSIFVASWPLWAAQRLSAASRPTIGRVQLISNSRVHLVRHVPRPE
jgi:hypothetical protein